MVEEKPEVAHTANPDPEHSSASEKHSHDVERPAEEKAAQSYIPQSDEEYDVTYVRPRKDLVYQV